MHFSKFFKTAFSALTGLSFAASANVVAVTDASECSWAYQETGIDWAHQNITRPGEGVVIAQMDTGYLPSPFFEAGTDASQPGLYLADQGRPRLGGILPILNWVEAGQPSLDFPSSSNVVSRWGHGASMEGIWLNRVTRGALFDGIVPYAQVIPYRISPYIVSANDAGAPAFTPTRNVARALRNAVAQGVDVISMSFAALTDTNSLQLGSAPSGGGLSLNWPVSDAGELGKALEYAAREGIIVVVAGGQNSPFPVVTATAGNPNVFAVGGSSKGMKPWALSNGVPQIVASGPSEGVCFARPNVESWQGSFDAADLVSVAQSFSWFKSEGTSYATAYTSGIAAMWIQAHPEIPKQQRVAAFRAALLDHGTVTPEGWPQSGYGKGIINARSLLENK